MSWPSNHISHCQLNDPPTPWLNITLSIDLSISSIAPITCIIASLVYVRGEVRPSIFFGHPQPLICTSSSPSPPFLCLAAASLLGVIRSPHFKGVGVDSDLPSSPSSPPAPSSPRIPNNPIPPRFHLGPVFLALLLLGVLSRAISSPLGFLKLGSLLSSPA